MCNSLNNYSLSANHFFTVFFLKCTIQFFTFQKLPKIINESHYLYHSSSLFTQLLFHYHPESHHSHPLFFLFSTILYLFFNFRVQTKLKKLARTEGVWVSQLQFQIDLFAFWILLIWPKCKIGNVVW